MAIYYLLCTYSLGMYEHEARLAKYLHGEFLGSLCCTAPSSVPGGGFDLIIQANSSVVGVVLVSPKVARHKGADLL